jgi:hypothetical protein
MKPRNVANASIAPGCGEAVVSKHGFLDSHLMGIRAPGRGVVYEVVIVRGLLPMKKLLLSALGASQVLAT